MQCSAVQCSAAQCSVQFSAVHCSFRGCDHRKTPALAGGAAGLGAKTPPRQEGTGGLAAIYNCGFSFGRGYHQFLQEHLFEEKPRTQDQV